MFEIVPYLRSILTFDNYKFN